MALLQSRCFSGFEAATSSASLEAFPVRGDGKRLPSCASTELGRRGAERARVGGRCISNKIFDASRRDDARKSSLRRVFVSNGAVIVAASAFRAQGVASRGSPAERHRRGFKPKLHGGEPSKPSKKMELKDNTDEEVDEDELEAFFAQLEEDLEAGGVSDLDDITEEEFAEFESELTAALVEIEEEEEEMMKSVPSAAHLGPILDVSHPESILSLPEQSEEVAEEDEEEWSSDDTLESHEELAEDTNRIVKLESWQLQKLAAAAELGRRKVNIKALSAEVGLDRFDVLAWLKDPPPELLMYSATMESTEQPRVPVSMSSSQALASIALADSDDVQAAADGKRNWQHQKRLRKDDEATLQLVFKKSSRPSNAMIQNLVELTHLPRRKILEWFEERRKQVKPKSKFEALR